MESKRKRTICQFCNNSYVNLRSHQQKAQFCLKIQQQGEKVEPTKKESRPEIRKQKETYEKQIAELTAMSEKKLGDLTAMYEKKLGDLQRFLRQGNSDKPASNDTPASNDIPASNDTPASDPASDNNLVPLTKECLGKYASHFTLRDLLDGADGHLKYCFKHVFPRDLYLELSSSRKKVIFFSGSGTKSMDGKALACDIVSSLKDQSVKLASGRLPKLYTLRDEIMRSSTNVSLEDVAGALEETNTDISFLTQIKECYEENFDKDYYKMLSSKIIKELNRAVTEDILRGLFIVFEGCDKSGKTTQSKILADKLPRSFRQQFPDRTTPVGKILNTYLQSDVELDCHASHLLFSANRWEVAEKIKDMLNKGINVIVDRYAYSGIACTVANNLGVSLDWAKQADTGLPKPDIVFYLDTPIEVIRERGDYGAERYETDSFQRRVSNIFGKDLFDETYWRKIDGSAPANEVTQNIMKAVEGINTPHLTGETLW